MNAPPLNSLETETTTDTYVISHACYVCVSQPKMNLGNFGRSLYTLVCDIVALNTVVLTSE